MGREGETERGVGDGVRYVGVGLEREGKGRERGREMEGDRRGMRWVDRERGSLGCIYRIR